MCWQRAVGAVFPSSSHVTAYEVAGEQNGQICKSVRIPCAVCARDPCGWYDAGIRDWGCGECADGVCGVRQFTEYGLMGVRYVLGLVVLSGRLWSNLFGNILLPEIARIPTKDRKVAVVGVTRLLTQCPSMRQGLNLPLWSVESLVTIIRSEMFIFSLL